MEPIIVTIKRSDESQELDLAVQPDVPIAQLSAFIAEGLTWNIDFKGQMRTYEVEVFPPGRMLSAQETLGDAQVENGNILIFHPILITKPSPVVESLPIFASTKTEVQALSENPVVGRRKLHTPVKTERPEDESHADSNGYVLKQIDED